MAVQRNKHFIYTVQSGDTLFSIARRFGSNVEAIERTNALYPPITDRELIYPGWVLVIPTALPDSAETTYIVGQGDTLYRISRRFATDVDVLMGTNPLIQSSNVIFLQQQLWVPAFVYEVVEGDSLNKLAAYFGIPLREIITANEKRPGFSPDLIYPGYRILLPLPSSRNIVVVHPLPGDKLQSGDRVEGLARVFEANVLIQVRDDQERIVSNERFTTASHGAPAYGYFNSRVPFDQQPSTTAGELWVYERSARDGSIINLVQVRVYF